MKNEQLKFYAWALFLLFGASTVWGIVYNVFQRGEISWLLIAGGGVLTLVCYLLQRDKEGNVEIGEYQGNAPVVKSRFFWGCTTKETGEDQRTPKTPQEPEPRD